ncbi:HIT domain-containing protein [Bacillus sp. z60-18]|uniref:HIT domain-containing protein n=1 Tax=unclassified Bacillus (in: firmicutes) TaxID=185979 RepID=UPI00390CAD1B
MCTCIFCDIAKQNVHCYEVYKNEHITSFLDLNPITNGHTLIIPNQHIEGWMNWTIPSWQAHS